MAVSRDKLPLPNFPAVFRKHQSCLYASIYRIRIFGTYYVPYIYHYIGLILPEHWAREKCLPTPWRPTRQPSRINVDSPCCREKAEGTPQRLVFAVKQGWIQAVQAGTSTPTYCNITTLLKLHGRKTNLVRLVRLLTLYLFTVSLEPEQCNHVNA